MITFADVRSALWRLYQKAIKHPEFCGKSSEGWCEVHYPEIYACADEAAYQQPSEIMIYSYALGPNRQHYIRRAKRDRRVSSNEWESPDICAKALEVIAEWDKDWDEWCKEQGA
jgi:hypothetical protein